MNVRCGEAAMRVLCKRRGLSNAGGACAVRVRCCYSGVPSPAQPSPTPFRSQGRRSYPFFYAPKAGGRRRRGGYPQQPPAAAAGYRQPPGLLRRAAVPVGPCARLLCKQPATRATAALAAKPESQPPSSRCHYSSQANTTIGKLKPILSPKIPIPSLHVVSERDILTGE